MARRTNRNAKRKPAAPLLAEPAFEEIAQRFRVLSDPLRLRLLYHLHDGEMSVGNLAERVGTSQPNASKQLSALRQAGFVERRQEGTTAFYAIADPSIFDLCNLVCGGIERELQRRVRAFE